MTWFTGVVVFLIIWWVVLFAVLPWGVRTPDNPEAGHATSAPVRPMLWRKVLITTLITCLLWGIAYWLITSDLISLRPDHPL
jgi:predicted secreted protein